MKRFKQAILVTSIIFFTGVMGSIQAAPFVLAENQKLTVNNIRQIENDQFCVSAAIEGHTSYLEDALLLLINIQTGETQHKIIPSPDSTFAGTHLDNCLKYKENIYVLQTIVTEDSGVGRLLLKLHKMTADGDILASVDVTPQAYMVYPYQFKVAEGKLIIEAITDDGKITEEDIPRTGPFHKTIIQLDTNLTVLGSHQDKATPDDIFKYYNDNRSKNLQKMFHLLTVK